MLEKISQFIEPNRGVVIGWILGTLSSFLIWIFRSWRHHRTRPKLKLSFDYNGFCVISTPAQGVIRLPGTQQTAQTVVAMTCIRLRAKVIRGGTANGCRVYITSISRGRTTAELKPIFQDAIPAIWSYRTGESSMEGIPIPPGIDQYIDTIHFTERHIHITAASYPFALGGFADAPGEYRIGFCVASDNARAVRIAMHWTRPENWDGQAESLKIRTVKARPED